MGDLKIEQTFSEAQKARFSSHLLSDLAALELLLKQGKIEKGITRIGAEQEFCLIDNAGRPSKMALEILEQLQDDHFTSELALFNLEINLDPIELSGKALSQMHKQLTSLLDLAAAKADVFDQNILLTGILPSITKRELEEEYMTPLPRYQALNERLKQLKRGDFSLFLTGVDELSIQHESVLFEACNTSFQMHFQIDPDDFQASYNWAQAISGPCLALACNSPLLLGRELWAETRIGLFQQSIDSRPSTYSLKEQLARVTFGHDWADGDIVDYFKNEIANYRVILGKEIEGNALESVKNGEVPKLAALNLHNGTIYKWNRPCYGVSGGVAHLRIENRYIPSGPSTLDEIANLAFWAGLMMGRPIKYDHIHESMNFSDAKANFINAARVGKRAQMSWMGCDVSVEDLVFEELLPIAKQGLEKAGIHPEEIDLYLTSITGRIYGQNGAEWMIKNFRLLKPGNRSDHAILDLVKNIHYFQSTSLPIHQWPEASPFHEIGTTPKVVAHKMSTRLFSVSRSDSAQMAMQIMKWKNIHHVPVEDETGQLCGLLTWTHLQKMDKLDSVATVEELMVKEIFTTQPQTPLNEAKELMQNRAIGCLPVVERGHLVGIITEKDF